MTSCTFHHIPLSFVERGSATVQEIIIKMIPCASAATDHSVMLSQQEAMLDQEENQRLNLMNNNMNFNQLQALAVPSLRFGSNEVLDLSFNPMIMNSSVITANGADDQFINEAPATQVSSLNFCNNKGVSVGGECVGKNKNENKSNCSGNDAMKGKGGVGSVRMKKKKMKTNRKKVREPRFCFKTMSADVDLLDDGYKWRKYGQKVVKNTQHPRSYYRCSRENCRVKKRVERLAEDPRMVITTYEGRHAHSPPHDDNDDDHDNNNSLSSSKNMSFIW